MDSLSTFLPTVLIIPFLVFGFVKHEIAEWSYERDQGLQGSSALFGLFVDITATIGQIGHYVLLITYGYDYGWRRAVTLFAAMLLIGMADQIIPVAIKRISTGLFLSFRLACLAAFYPMLAYLCYQLSWFGLLKNGP